jgi:hypothetical protein
MEKPWVVQERIAYTDGWTVVLRRAIDPCANCVIILWVCAILDTGGEVIFATASRPTHLVFNSLPNMNCAYFRLRQQYLAYNRSVP